MATTKYIDIKIRSRSAEKKVDSLDKSMVRLGKDTDKTSKSFGALSKVATAVATALSAIQIGQFSDGIAKADNQLRNVTTSTKQFSEAQSELNRIANDTRQNVNELTDVYSKFARASSELGLTQREVLEFTESLTKAVKIEGNTAAEVNSVMLQLTQSFRSGVIAGEEFKAISEGSGLALKALAIQMGVNVGELKKLASQGLITPETLIKGLAKLKPELDKQFIALQPTFEDAGTRLSNALSESFRSSSLGSFFSTLNTGIIGGIDAISERLTDSGELIVKQYDLMEILGSDAVVAIKASAVELVSLRGQIKKSTDPKEILELQGKIKELKTEIDSTEGNISFLDKHFGDVTGLKREYAQLIIKIEEAKAATSAAGSTLDIEITGGSTKPAEIASPKESKFAQETKDLQLALALRASVIQESINAEEASEIIRFTNKANRQQELFTLELEKLGTDEAARIALTEEFRALQLATAQEFEANMTDAKAEGTNDRISLDNEELQSKIQMAQGIVGLMQSFAGKSKKASKALMLIQGALSAYQIYASTEAAAALALAQPPGPPTTIPFAAAISTSGKLKAGAVLAGAATGAFSGGGGGGGSPSSPISRPSGTTSPASEVPQQNRVIDIRLDDDAILTGSAVKQLMSSVLGGDDDITLQITSNQAELTRTGAI
tara:strand:- start:2087 stop:4090 length:2004 start_codon:yes stop_codon:yes gene_type:complete